MRQQQKQLKKQLKCGYEVNTSLCYHFTQRGIVQIPFFCLIEIPNVKMSALGILRIRTVRTKDI